ncbi:MAG: N-acetylmuramic acid 6-phosphate etherase [Planctomyces sp.]|nr:N-acetylmuramic acid 6-phosphate etherase [Planctomyces sp.]
MSTPPTSTTESRNAASAQIDTLSPLQFADLMNQEDATVAAAVRRELPGIAQAIEVISDRLRNHGRLFYIGAGTSGRLGVLDASECPPTFSTPPELVVGIIAGGPAALTRAIEGAEDNAAQAEVDLKQVNLCAKDVLVGIAASGRTPYVIHALRYARSLGAFAIGFACNEHSAMQSEADLMITTVVGPEIITGSTRLKSGTATKMVLNMLTTGAMVQLGKTYGNLMVDLRATNEKLRNRSQKIVAEITGLAQTDAEKVLELCGGEVKTAIVMTVRHTTPDNARALLKAAGGQLRGAIQPTENPS